MACEKFLTYACCYQFWRIRDYLFDYWFIQMQKCIDADGECLYKL